MHEKIMTLRDKLLAEAQEVNAVKIVRYEGSLTADQVKTLAFQMRNIHVITSYSIHYTKLYDVQKERN